MDFERMRTEKIYRVFRFLAIFTFIITLAYSVNLYLKYNELQKLYLQKSQCGTTQAQTHKPPQPTQPQEPSGLEFCTQDPQALHAQTSHKAINTQFYKLHKEIQSDLQHKREELAKQETQAQEQAQAQLESTQAQTHTLKDAHSSQEKPTQ